MIRRLLVSMVMLSLGAMTPVAIAQTPDPAPSEPVRLELEDLQKTRRSLSDYNGRIVVLNFWATWCIPCREEMPLLVSLHKRYAARGVEFIAASADEMGRLPEVARFARRHKLSFPVWVGATTEDMSALGLGEALPATAIIDRDGTVAARLLGPIHEEDLVERLDWLLGGREDEQPPVQIETFDEEPSEDHEGHDHEAGEEDHAHGGVGMEGASLVPS